MVTTLLQGRVERTRVVAAGAKQVAGVAALVAEGRETACEKGVEFDGQLPGGFGAIVVAGLLKDETVVMQELRVAGIEE